MNEEVGTQINVNKSEKEIDEEVKAKTQSESSTEEEEISTILWHYGKTKNEDGAISESEVTGTIASKFGGPRITKEHVPDTTNYPTPIPPTRKLK
ncbi:hypothetical protein H5410_006326 [Solanum commersonii]|uniref:Uncharacterized protein n=1 Tax=Solanum commersonii TaxID=4109 RepID=A0A9J6A9Z3_SOLCO|nr:hypothetical protein H5410_006326 [Solanum commersonii]